MFDGPKKNEPDEERSGRIARTEDHPAPPRRKALFVLKRTFREFSDDGSTDLAAALTYYSVLAIFPGLIALMSLVGIFGQAQESVDEDPGDPAAAGLARRLEQRHQQVLNGLVDVQGAGIAWSSVCSVRCGRRRATSAPSAGR